MDKNKFTPSWNTYSLGIIALIIFLQVLRWPISPTFLDIYYHLSVILGFDKAGGYVLHDFWEYAPVGRPHLYPPLLHILMLLFYKAGLSKIFIARIFNLGIFPLSLFAAWFFVKKIFTPRLAFFAVLAYSSAFCFYLSVSNTVASGLSIICGLFSFACLEKGKKVSAVIFLAGSFYAHAVMSWLLALTFILYGFLNREKFLIYLKTVAIAIIASLPILTHQYLNRSYFSFVNLTENSQIAISILIFGFASFGIFYSLQKKGRYFLFLALVLSFLAVGVKYPFRYLCGEGLIGLIFLSAVALDSFYDLIHSGRAKGIYLILIIILFFIISPSFGMSLNRPRLTFFDSTLVNLMPEWKQYHPASEISILHPHYYREIVKIIKENSGEEDIICSNFDYLAGALGIFADRATSTAMLREVKPIFMPERIKVAKLLVWLKDPIDLQKEPLTLIGRYNLRKIGETSLVFIYENPFPAGRRTITWSIIPTPALFIVLLSLMSLVYLDISGKLRISS